jgi:hypothetical protein
MFTYTGTTVFFYLNHEFKHLKLLLHFISRMIYGMPKKHTQNKYEQ